MEFQKGTPGNTLAFSPTRDVCFIIDPRCITRLKQKVYADALQLIRDLGLLDPPVSIRLLLPSYLADKAIRPLAAALGPLIMQLGEPGDIPPFSLDPNISKAFREALLASNDEAKLAMNMLALSNTLQADGIVTEAQVLTNARYPLYNTHLIRIVPLEELLDIVEIFAHGHSIFWSGSNPDRRLTPEVFYTWAHWKCSRYFRWFCKVQPTLGNKELEENLRSILLNRYTFLLYSRDMVRFSQLQRDYYSRRGLLERFSMLVGYHVTTFYLLLWGMLDHLTVLAKCAKELGIDEKNCGIKYQAFWKQFGQKCPGLERLVKDAKVDEWIDQMADMRHAAAHRGIPVPTQLREVTEESEKSNEEILEIVKKEKAAWYTLFPPEFMRRVESQMVWHWRMSKMKMIMPSIVEIKGRGKTYLRDPVGSIEYDLERLTALMDAFVIGLFNNS